MFEFLDVSHHLGHFFKFWPIFPPPKLIPLFQVHQMIHLFMLVPCGYSNTRHLLPSILVSNCSHLHSVHQRICEAHAWERHRWRPHHQLGQHERASCDSQRLVTLLRRHETCCQSAHHGYCFFNGIVVCGHKKLKSLKSRLREVVRCTLPEHTADVCFQPWSVL